LELARAEPSGSVKQRFDALGDSYKSPALRRLLRAVTGDWGRIERVD